MITGSNTNVRHKGRLFHVQTEDSGRRNPHIISHLYFSGTILASEKTDYSDRFDLESETLDKEVRALIEEQHKKMLIRLKHGDFDAVIAQRLGDAGESTGTEPSTASPVATPQAPSEPAAQPAPAPPAPGPSAARPASGRAFGDGIVSQKPLDEVILEYLVEKSRADTGSRERPPAERPRKRE
jgi:hypothetical protein